MSNKVVTLDVREDIQRGREPFSRIMQAVGALKANEDLLLVAPFEPKPLYGVMAQQGFAYRVTPAADGSWEVRFTRSRAGGVAPAANSSSQPVASAGTHTACSGIPTIEVDALARIFHRGIEQRSGESVIRLESPSQNENATHRFFHDRL